MIFETSFYLDQPVSPEIIMAFAKTFDGRLNRMTITDANLKSRSSRPDQDKMVQALAADLPPRHIQLFQRGKDGNNNFPEYSLALISLSQVEEEDQIFSLIAYIPATDKDQLAADWWNLATEAGAKAGNGYLLHQPIRDINYGMFGSSVPNVRTPTWEAFDASCRRFIRDRPSFLPVVEGKMLRNVLRQNFMTTALAEAIKDTLCRSGLPVNGFAPFPQDRVIWTLPDSEMQRLAHDALHPERLVWENDWIDLAGYLPSQ